MKNKIIVLVFIVLSVSCVRNESQDYKQIIISSEPNKETHGDIEISDELEVDTNYILQVHQAT